MSSSTAHESVLLWLRDDPSWLCALLKLTGHAPCSATLAVQDSALREAFPLEVTPDLVLRDGARWMVVEIQRRRDPEKARRWPLAMAAMSNCYGPDGELVVITHSAAVARWALHVAVRQTGATRWGVVPTVVLLGRAEAEAILATAAPEMAVFAAWVMQERFGRVAADLARRALERAETVADARLRRVTKEGILAVLHPTLTEKLRSALMIDINQLPKNPVLERWKAELRAEGVALGEASGEARMLVRILRRRGFVLSADLAARVLATTDIERIERWADRALVAATLDAVFVED